MGLFTLLTGLFYPFFMAGIGQLFFRRQAEGLPLYQGGRLIGAQSIAQRFVSPRYFHPRPSACDYDGAGSSAAHLGPTSQRLFETIKERAEAYRQENRLPAHAIVPADAVTASGSGLDPHITLDNARLQAPRVAEARGLPLETVLELLKKQTQHRTLGLIGEARVNVLQLNLALDATKPF
jgi:K+-transporting ATPase ATPase C chain